MKVVWLTRARASRHAAIEYIAKDNVSAALRQLGEIEQQTDLLAEFPELGRIGRREGTRELVIGRTPSSLFTASMLDATGSRLCGFFTVPRSGSEKPGVGAGRLDVNRMLAEFQELHAITRRGQRRNQPGLSLAMPLRSPPKPRLRPAT